MPRSDVRLHQLTIFGAIPLLFAINACAPQTNEEEDAVDWTEAEAKKKVKPKGGNGAFELASPSWSTNGAIGEFKFDGAVLKIGQRSERTGGSYALRTISNSSDNNGVPARQNLNIDIPARTVVTKKPAGLRVRYAEPLTLGGSYVWVGEDSETRGHFRYDGPWRKDAGGVTMLLLPSTFPLASDATGPLSPMTLAEGELKEIVLPIAKLKFEVDPYDPSYPTVTGCVPPTLRAGTDSFSETSPVRKPDGTAMPAFVVPQGARAKIVLGVYGLYTNYTPAAGETITIPLNRLEVEDVEVADADGSTRLVKGTFSVERKNDASGWSSVGCTSPTKAGMDLMNGTYRVTARADTPKGTVQHVEEVTFP